MGRWPHGPSRTAWAAAASASLDRADQAERMQTALEQAGFVVERHPHSSGRDVSIHLDRGDPAEDLWFTGPTALDALVLATSWAIGDGSEGGET